MIFEGMWETYNYFKKELQNDCEHGKPLHHFSLSW